MRPSNPSTERADEPRAAGPRARIRSPWRRTARRLVRRLVESAPGDDAGNAPLEFIVAGLILLVPTVYLVVTLGLVQEQALGVEAGSRHIARAVATSTGQATAAASADAVLASITAEYGLDPSTVAVSTACLGGGACPQAGATLVVTVTARVPLPLVPPVLGLDTIAAIPVQATSAQKVSRFWEGG